MKLIFSLAMTLMISYAQGQALPSLFEPGLISDDGVFGLTISPDSKIALWVSSKGKRDTLKIMESRKVNGAWTQPKVASFSAARGEWKDIDPVFSPDGKKVLFQSNRSTHRSAERKDFDIWMVELVGEGWGKEYPLKGDINTEASESYASITKDGTIYFMKDNTDGIGQSDIYYSVLKGGKYEEAKNIGFPINTSERESNPFISANGDYIIYFSTDKSGYGEVDLYISVKKGNHWTTPKNLGQPINSTAAEFCPFFHEREKKLYFSRQEKQGERFKENIYSVDFDLKILE